MSPAHSQQRPNSNAVSHEPLLRASGLCKQFVQRRNFSRTKFFVSAFEDVNLQLFRGKTLALVGESGAGKSTLVRCIALLERPSAGKITLDGTDLLTLDRRQLFPIRRRIQLIFQDPASALNPQLTALEIIAEPLAVQKVGNKLERHERALQLMEQVGLETAAAQKKPFEFSGGQRQRLAIARALALEPDVLILDESLSALDALNRDLIVRLLLDLQDARALAYLYVSHDLRLVSQFADEVAVMHEGKIVERQETRDIFAHPAHFHTRELLSTVHSVESILLERSA
ncbi:MAG: ATP-binding cassette domain-containing protein [Candidatus Acidiferrales bacterium]